MSQSAQRNITVDIMRTLAIVLMVIFHFIYDLKFFGWVDSGIPDGQGWRQFRYVILTLFFLCVGSGLVFAHQVNPQQSIRKYLIRLSKVGLAAALVSVMSLVMVPQNYIYFGVLHFIFVASVMVYPVIRYPNIALIIGGVLLSLDWFNIVSQRWPFGYIREFLPNYTNDYVPIVPWVGVVCIGIWLAYQNWFIQDPLSKLKIKPWFYLPGKYSLSIYLIHQPLLFALFYLILLV